MIRVPLLVAITLISGVANAAAFLPLGDLSGGTVHSEARGVSDDGLVVAGYSNGTNDLEAFRWTNGVMTGIGQLPGSLYSTASGISGDGAVIIGSSQPASAPLAYRWSASTGMVSLGELPGGGTYSHAYGVSGDGNVIVGASGSASGTEAFIWTPAGGMVGLGDLPGGFFGSAALAVTPDGTVVVGDGISAAGGEAFRWTAADGFLGLGDLAGGAYSSIANDVSDDGSVIVGFGTSASGTEAFRWTAASGLVGLGDIAGESSPTSAWAVSGDGRIVVGERNTGDYNASEAIIWTEELGMQRLLDFLVANGATGLTGWTLRQAMDVSSDGTWIVGRGINPDGKSEAFLAHIQVVPLPASVWLLGTAVGLLGAGMGRKVRLAAGQLRAPSV